MDGHAKLHSRRRLERDLRRPIPDEVWADLEDRRYVDDALSREGWEDLLSEARRLLRFMDLGAMGAATHRQPSAAGSTSIRARGEAFSAWVARLATEGSSNLRLLRGWWGGELLTPEEALAYTRSIAWRHVWVEDLIAPPGGAPDLAISGARVRGLSARVVSQAFDRVPRGRELRRVVRRVVELRLGGDVQLVEYEEMTDSQIAVAITIPSGEVLRLGASYHSLVGKLGELAAQLSSSAPWTRGEAAWFVLTGDAPYVPPMTAKRRRTDGIGHERDVVVLEVEPWVPVRAVAAAFRAEQRELLTKTNRPIRERSTELARFLAGETRGRSIRDRMRLWNELHPGWAERDPRNFRSRGARVIEELLHPRAQLNGGHEPPRSG